ncbi:MAG: hypothetical protein HQ466_06920 [Cryomorphaceae bacterium]|nr:hypothetical protein [Cryomorphaceae bacterium]
MNKPARWRVLEWIYYFTAVLSAEAAWSLRNYDSSRSLLFAGFVVLSLAMALWRRNQRIKSSKES